MSYEDGWAAINLQMPRRVPRTEFSADMHWELVQAVTGIEVNPQTPPARRWEAAVAFMKAWNYDMMWNTLIGGEVFGKLTTDMGHATYAAGGVDYRPVGQEAWPDPEDILNLDFEATFGRKKHADLVKAFDDNYDRQCRNCGFAVNMTGIYVTMISGFIALFGWDKLLLAAGTDQKRFGDLADRYGRWVKQYFDALAACKAPVVMIHDDMVWTAGAIFRPEWYRQYVFPNFKRCFEPLLAAGKKVLFTADGNYTEFIDDVAATGVSGFVMEPLTDMAYIAAKYGRTHVFVGNADTRILLMGTKAQIRAEVERCMSIGKKCPGFFMAVGNHIPPNTPVENCLYYNQVYEALSRR